jgi:hypothetical protein
LSVITKSLTLAATAGAVTALASTAPAAVAAPSHHTARWAHRYSNAAISIERARVDSQGEVTIELSYLCKRADKIDQITASATQDQGQPPVRVFGQDNGSATDCTGHWEPDEVHLSSSTDQQFVGGVPIHIVASIRTGNGVTAGDVATVCPALKP